MQISGAILERLGIRPGGEEFPAFDPERDTYIAASGNGRRRARRLFRRASQASAARLCPAPRRPRPHDGTRLLTWRRGNTWKVTHTDRLPGGSGWNLL